MGLLPTTSDAPIERSGDPTVVPIDDDRSEEVLAAVGSETARSVFRTICREPMPPTEIAEALDMSVEGVGYHLDNLEEAGLVAVLDTVYSEKGREMDVYGPAEEPLLLFFGSAADERRLRRAFSDLVPVVGPAAIGIVLKRALLDPFDLGDLF